MADAEVNGRFNSGAGQQRAYIAWDSGYRSEGIAVDVVDRGIYYNRDAFSSDPVDPKYTEEDIAALLAEFDFEAEARMSFFTSEQAYHSSKILFVFDYAQNNADVSHTANNPHGTHVAGIVAADETGGGNFGPGVTSEAQLVVMRVSNGATVGFTDSLSAMEDCILLGVAVSAALPDMTIWRVLRRYSIPPTASA